MQTSANDYIRVNIDHEENTHIKQFKDEEDADHIRVNIDHEEIKKSQSHSIYTH
jgi:hypothetical protein